MNTSLEGVLEINHENGIIYFHANEGNTILRIQNLPTPIPRVRGNDIPPLLDVRHLHATSWDRHRHQEVEDQRYKTYREQKTILAPPNVRKPKQKQKQKQERKTSTRPFSPTAEEM